MVLELFEDGLVLIFNIKSDKQFKVNGHGLKPYLALEPLDETRPRGHRFHTVSCQK